MTISIEKLRTVRLGTRDIAASADFAQRILGLEPVGRTERLAYFRSDHRDHTLVYVADSDERVVALEVREPETLDAAQAELAARGITMARGDAAACQERRVQAFGAFTLPGGAAIELVVRPLHSGWRYFPSRDAGITGLAAVVLRSAKPAADEALLTTVFSGRVSDWVGDAAFIRFDEAHHRLAVYPSESAGILAVEFSVESADQLMQTSYFLSQTQVKVVHGPGRRPTSGQMFLTFQGPDGVLYSVTAEGDAIDEARHRPRQFVKEPRSFCAWGSQSDWPEFS